MGGLVALGLYRLAPDREAHRQTTDPQEAAIQIDAVARKIQSALDGGSISPGTVRELQEAARRYPDDPQLPRLLGQVLYVHGNRQEAYAQWQRSLELDPRQPELQLTAGTLAFDLGEVRKAAGHYSQAVSLETTNTRYLLHLARAQIELADYDAARSTLLRALSLDSTQHEAHASLADLYKRQNKLTSALTQIDKAIETAPSLATEARVQYTLTKARILRSNNQPQDALVLLGNLPEMDQDRREVLDSMATCWAMLEKPDRAALLYEEALQAHPLDWEMAALAAQWRLRSGDPESARRHLQTVRRINPRAPVIQELQEKLETASP